MSNRKMPTKGAPIFSFMSIDFLFCLSFDSKAKFLLVYTNIIGVGMAYYVVV